MARPPGPSTARERALDAFERLLRTSGERAATLDAIAADAGISKGGLLYHFESKDALVTGLLERFDVLSRAELDRYRDSEGGVIQAFLRSSPDADSPFDHCFQALVALSQSGRHPRTRAALEGTVQGWYDVIHDEVGDPVVARIVQVLGDGIHYGSSFEGVPRLSEGEMESVVDALTLLIEVRADKDSAR